jgi:hypothetical protein
MNSDKIWKKILNVNQMKKDVQEDSEVMVIMIGGDGGGGEWW